MGDVFNDIEQDNNPSFYGDTLILANPYPHTRSQQQPALPVPPPQHSPRLQQQPPQAREQSPDATDLVNSTLGLSNKILALLDLLDLEIAVVASEHLVGTSVVVYLIQFGRKGDSDDQRIIVKRRYSEFKLFREQLLRLFPTVIVPPIPEKHTLLSYLVNSIDNSHEIHIIDLRKRYFTRFLRELIFASDPRLRQLALTVKFLDPNYEMAWDNALLEPPVLVLPKLMLLANPVDTTDQNGLYVLLPLINGFDISKLLDNMPLLRRINDDLAKLWEQIQLMEAKRHEFETRLKMTLPANSEDENFTPFHNIPPELVKFENEFHQLIKALDDLDKLNNRLVKNYKQMIHNLIELGGNLNNFSLQVYDNSPGVDNSLSAAIEKFGLAIDSNFLNFEGFLQDRLITEWQEPVHQMNQYFYLALILIKFYKYKVIQYKLLYKLKFQKYQEMFGAVSVPEAPGKPADLDHLEGLPLASLSQAIQKIKHAKDTGQAGQLRQKKSWYGIFGGGLNYNKQFSKRLSAVEAEEGENGADVGSKFIQMERELTKVAQLIALTTRDMNNLTDELIKTYRQFIKQLERKWLELMIAYLRLGKQLFEANRDNFTELREWLEQAP